jgi:hypothetical protein
MRLTIIPTDNTVYVENQPKLGLDLSACGIPQDVHALQWYETRGWIEPTNDEDPFTPALDNIDIYELPQWALDCYQIWVDTPFPPDPWATEVI